MASERCRTSQPLFHKLSDMTKPDPLAPGNIPGQNPATPERLPGHSADAPPKASMPGNEEELGGRPAFLYHAGDMAAVTLDSSGANLPAPPGAQPWVLSRDFTLGVRDVGLENMSPEPIIRGIYSEGYYMWRTNDPSHTSGTTD